MYQYDEEFFVPKITHIVLITSVIDAEPLNISLIGRICYVYFSLVWLGPIFVQGILAGCIIAPHIKQGLAMRG